MEGSGIQCSTLNVPKLVSHENYWFFQIFDIYSTPGKDLSDSSDTVVSKINIFASIQCHKS